MSSTTFLVVPRRQQQSFGTTYPNIYKPGLKVVVTYFLSLSATFSPTPFSSLPCLKESMSGTQPTEVQAGRADPQVFEGSQLVITC